jgi:hypothetical protein
MVPGLRITCAHPLACLRSTARYEASMYTTTIALALALAPSTPTDYAPPPFEVGRVALIRTDPCADIEAFDSAGHFAGSVTLCANEAGLVDVDADFVDGLYLVLRYDDAGNPVIDSNDATDAAERLRVIAGVAVPVDGWFPCALGVAGTVGAIIAVNAVGAVINTYAMACECLPLLVEEFEEIDCPGF